MVMTGIDPEKWRRVPLDVRKQLIEKFGLNRPGKADTMAIAALDKAVDEYLSKREGKATPKKDVLVFEQGDDLTAQQLASFSETESQLDIQPAADAEHPDTTQEIVTQTVPGESESISVVSLQEFTAPAAMVKNSLGVNAPAVRIIPDNDRIADNSIVSVTQSQTRQPVFLKIAVPTAGMYFSFPVDDCIETENGFLVCVFNEFIMIPIEDQSQQLHALTMELPDGKEVEAIYVTQFSRNDQVYVVFAVRS